MVERDELYRKVQQYEQELARVRQEAPRQEEVLRRTTGERDEFQMRLQQFS